MTQMESDPPRIVSRGLALSIAGLVAGFTIVRYGLLSEAAADWFDDGAWTLFSGAAALRSLRAASSTQVPRHRVGWTLLGIGAGLWFVGMLFLVWGALSSPTFSPYPTPANWLFLALGPFFTAGILFLRSHSGAPVDGKRLADLGLITCAVLAMSAAVLVEPLVGTGRSAEAVLFSVLDPAVYVTATIFTLALWRLGDLRGLGPVAPLLLGSVVVHMTADLAYFRAVLVPAEAGGLPLAPTWLIAFGFQFLAADAYDRLVDVEDAGTRGAGRPRHGLLEATLPAFLVALIALVGVIFRDQLDGQTMLVAAPLLLLFALLLAFREWWVDRAERRALERLEASVDLTHQILAASPAAVFTLEPDSGTGPRFFTGRRAHTFALESDAPGDWTLRVHPEDRDEVRRHVRNVLVQGSRSFDCRLEDDTGSYRWVTVRLAPYDPGGRGAGRVVGSIVDIDDAKRLEDRVLRGQRMEALGRLSGGIAHDFNNLLTTILGYAELGAMEDGLSANAKESFERVRDASERARGLTRQLLAFSRRQEMTMEVIDLRHRVRDMTKLLTRNLGPGVSVDLRTPEHPIPVRADPSQMEQVVLNLVVNAGDAMPEGGELTISVDDVLIDTRTAGGENVPPGRYARLSVTDTGIGMSEEIRERVFEPFFTTKAGGRGTGLGLATIHGVVRQHGGYVDVMSRLGVGTTFHVYLPLSGEPIEHASDGPSRTMGSGSETILVVDDEPSVSKLLDDALSPAGYRILTASSAGVAIALAEDRAQRIDLLLTDVVMPDMPGRDLAAVLRDLRPELPVVYMSGSVDETHLLGDAPDTGVPFVAKPLSLVALVGLLRSIFDAHGPAAERSGA